MKAEDASRLKKATGQSRFAIDVACGVESHEDVASFVIDLSESVPEWSAFGEGKLWRRGHGTTHWVRPADFYAELVGNEIAADVTDGVERRGRYHLFCKKCRKDRVKSKGGEAKRPIYDVPVADGLLWQVLDRIALNAQADPEIELKSAGVARVQLSYLAAKVRSAEE